MVAFMEVATEGIKEIKFGVMSSEFGVHNQYISDYHNNVANEKFYQGLKNISDFILQYNSKNDKYSEYLSPTKANVIHIYLGTMIVYSK